MRRGVARLLPWWGRPALAVATTVAFVACAAQQEPVVVPEDSTGISSTSVEPTTTLSLATAPSTSAVVEGPVWLATYRRESPGYVVELVDVFTGETRVVATDRLRPYPGRVFGDGAGGLIVESPLALLAAGEAHGRAIGPEGVTLSTVTAIDGEATVLYRTQTGRSEWEGDIIWHEVDHEVVALPVDGLPTVILTAHSSGWVDYPAGKGEQTGPWLADAGHGGDVLALLWTTFADECSWLELRSGADDDSARVVNPWPAEACNESGSMLDIAVTADGTTVVAQVSPSVRPDLGGPDLVAWDVGTGEEIDRLPGVLVFVHDGNRGLGVDRRVDPTTTEIAYVRVAETGFSVVPVPGLSGGLLGVVQGPLSIEAGATLAREEAWTSCSAKDHVLSDQSGLPAAVAETRRAIGAAASACDLVALADLAMRSPEFRMVETDVSCGEPSPMSLKDDDFVPYWYRGDSEHRELQVILATLGTPFRTEDGRYVWSDAHGYRIEIDSDGHWLLDRRGFPLPPCEGWQCTC